MAQAPKLQMKQVLGPRMTPELRQSLELLQLGALALNDFVQKEIEANPMLEFEPGWEGPKQGSSGEVKKAGPDVSEVEGFVKIEKTLASHLQDQILFLGLAGTEAAVAQQLAGNLNGAGYLTAELDDIAFSVGVEEAVVKRVLHQLQGLDPAGVFARDLQECLALQLRDQGLEGPIKLLAHLDLLARRDFEGLKRETGLSRSEIEKAIIHIQSLDPKPGERFASGDPLQTMTPDVLVRPERGGGFVIELNPDTLPKILINETYVTAFDGKKLKAKEKDYLKTCRRRAGWLKRGLDQRARTMLAVAKAMVATQSRFFSEGLLALTPMTMRDIALAVDVHESTVSRVVANKFLSCPGGVYPLRFFFSSGVKSHTAGGASSAHAIKARIKALVASEDKVKPLSDQKLCQLLKGEGLEISRRTVMKYRESLKIPSSFDRKKR